MARRRPRADGGFTLVELIIAIAIMGLLVTTLVGVLFASVKANEDTTRRLDGTRDEQFSSVYFAPDVQGASSVATGVTATCGTGTAFLDLRGTSFDPASLVTTQTAVSYVFTTVTSGGVASGRVERRTCEAASLAAGSPPQARTAVARNLATTPPTVACSPSPCGASTRTVTVTFARIAPEVAFSMTATRRPT